ncbi:hypothetical protein [Amycolatopsis sp. 195334CR]|uniref:hypothetical protein n=1 Tax=Amycolatopsis sp. 195334CR TaxID=2814588 RepID=UPI001A8E3134|nr:hypothetical protein [Amycolatopsis sp. 195334CR]MBN6037470.1 hypothetical protein [Amycolatopsis sp. 195334CR]
MTARKNSPRKPAVKPTPDSTPEPARCRVGRDLEPDAPECPRSEFESGTGLCNLHFVTRLDLREVARHD